MFVFAVSVVFVQFGWCLKLMKRGSTLNLERSWRKLPFMLDCMNKVSR